MRTTNTNNTNTAQQTAQQTARIDSIVYTTADIDKLSFRGLLNNVAYWYMLDSTPIYTAQCEEMTTAVITTLATTLAYSVLRKCIDVSYNEMLCEVRKELTITTKALNTIDYLNNSDMVKTVLTFDRDGNETTETITDTVRMKAYIDALHSTQGDGLDLVHTAIVALYEEMSAQLEREGYIDLERTYTGRKLSRKVYINNDNKPTFEDTETSPIKEAYRATRRYIQCTRAQATDTRNGYFYIEDLTSDGEADTEEKIYRRLPKYTDLATSMEIRQHNGKAVVTMATDSATVDRFNELLEMILPVLTDRQKVVLNYRLKGYGYMAIANKLGVSKNAVVKTVKAIQTKCIDLGIKPTTEKQ